MTAPTPIADSLVGPLLLGLRDCLYAETYDTLSGPVCRRYVSWDQGVPVMDGCTCECVTADGRKGVGDAWVRLVSVAPNLGLGVLGAASTGGGWDPMVCFPGWVATIELGIMRCHPTPEEPTVPLSDQTNTDVAMWRLSDFAAMRRAWRCCVVTKELTSIPVLFSPLGPSGDCSGGTLTINVELSTTDICVERNP